MKNPIKKFFVPVVVCGLLSGCIGENSSSSAGNTEKINATDSLEIIENDMKEIEEAHLDSIKMANLRQLYDEKEASRAFFNALPLPGQIFNNEDAGKYLTSIGFKGETQFKDDDETVGKYKFSMGDRKCEIQFSINPRHSQTQVTITGDKQALDRYFNKAEEIKENYHEFSVKIEKQDNTINISAE